MSRPIDISLYQIQVFVKAAEFKSFTAVATHFNTTQSAISKSVAATEAVLGFPLFIRSLNKLELSAQGKYLYEHWRGRFSARSIPRWAWQSAAPSAATASTAGA